MRKISSGRDVVADSAQNSQNFDILETESAIPHDSMEYDSNFVDQTEHKLTTREYNNLTQPIEEPPNQLLSKPKSARVRN